MLTQPSCPSSVPMRSRRCAKAMLHVLRTEAGFRGVLAPASRCSSDENIAEDTVCHPTSLGVVPMLNEQSGLPSKRI